MKRIQLQQYPHRKLSTRTYLSTRIDSKSSSFNKASSFGSKSECIYNVHHSKKMSSDVEGMLDHELKLVNYQNGAEKSIGSVLNATSFPQTTKQDNIVLFVEQHKLVKFLDSIGKQFTSERIRSPLFGMGFGASKPQTDVELIEIEDEEFEKEIEEHKQKESCELSQILKRNDFLEKQNFDLSQQLENAHSELNEKLKDLKLRERQFSTLYKEFQKTLEYHCDKENDINDPNVNFDIYNEVLKNKGYQTERIPKTKPPKNSTTNIPNAQKTKPQIKRGEVFIKRRSSLKKWKIVGFKSFEFDLLSGMSNNLQKIAKQYIELSKNKKKGSKKKEKKVLKQMVSLFNKILLIFRGRFPELFKWFNSQNIDYKNFVKEINRTTSDIQPVSLRV